MCLRQGSDPSAAWRVYRSPRAVRLARSRGAQALCADVFKPLPGVGLWRTVLLVDGNIGLAGDPLRILRRCRDMLAVAGYGVVEFDTHHRGATTTLTRLETDDHAGPWFPWATVGLDHAEELAERAGLRLKDVQVIGDRALASMACL